MAFSLPGAIVFSQLQQRQAAPAKTLASARLRLVLATRWPAARSCQPLCPYAQGAPVQPDWHHRLRQIGTRWPQSVGTAVVRHAKPFGFGSLSPRAGGAVASSVTMRPFLSRALVKKSHIVTCRQIVRLLVLVSRKGWVQPLRSHARVTASAAQDGSQSAVALGVCLGSLAHRG